MSLEAVQEVRGLLLLPIALLLLIILALLLLLLLLALLLLLLLDLLLRGLYFSGYWIFQSYAISNI